MEDKTNTEVLIERRERSFFGKTMLWLFWGWQALMVYVAIDYAIQLKGSIDPSDGWTTVGSLAGVYVGVFLILAIWFVGTIVTGALALGTRGAKKIIQSEQK